MILVNTNNHDVYVNHDGFQILLKAFEEKEVGSMTGYILPEGVVVKKDSAQMLTEIDPYTEAKVENRVVPNADLLNESHTGVRG